MRLLGLLNWYDEQPHQLIECIRGLKLAGVSHVVAVDGAYDLFPGGKAASPVAQATAIYQQCRLMDMGCMVYVPKKTWAGNEVEKRTFMHHLALSASDKGDWHMVMDADQVVTDVPPDFHGRLQQSGLDVAEVTFTEHGNPLSRPRILFRAIPVRLERNHYTYVTPDERVLWCGEEQPQEPCIEIRELVVDHQPKMRTPSRLENRSGYYAIRTEVDAEFVHCYRCGNRAVRRMPYHWRLDPAVGHLADWVEVCGPCANGVHKENRSTLSTLGLNPDTVNVVSHDNLAYAVAADGRGLPDLFRQWLEERK